MTFMVDNGNMCCVNKFDFMFSLFAWCSGYSDIWAAGWQTDVQGYHNTASRGVCHLGLVA